MRRRGDAGAAGGTLTVHDVDAGENHFPRTPAALAGTYGNFTFNPTTGVWGYTLDQTRRKRSNAGQHVTDTLTVTSFDGTASQTITVTITGSQRRRHHHRVGDRGHLGDRGRRRANATPGDARRHGGRHADRA